MTAPVPGRGPDGPAHQGVGTGRPRSTPPARTDAAA